jgi:T-complex protein 1 subunit beta
MHEKQTSTFSCLGGDIVSTFDTPDKVRLGKCNVIEEIMIGEEKLIKFFGSINM